MMELTQRSYSGRFFRPRPLIEEDRSSGTFIVATSWGAPEHSRRAVDIVKDHLSHTEDDESTRVGTFVQDLTDEGNRLRSAVLQANEFLFLRENNKEWIAAVELAVITIKKQTLSWVQIGNPHLVLSTKVGIEPVCYSPDWSWQVQQNAPLVGKALGLSRKCHLNCGSYRLPGAGPEKVFLVARSGIPGGFYSMKQPDLASASQVLVDDNPNSPFWLGMLELK